MQVIGARWTRTPNPEHQKNSADILQEGTKYHSAKNTLAGLYERYITFDTHLDIVSDIVLPFKI